jgi:hypothetical protein
MYNLVQWQIISNFLIERVRKAVVQEVDFLRNCSYKYLAILSILAAVIFLFAKAFFSGLSE